jgi:cathepsin D
VEETNTVKYKAGCQMLRIITATQMSDDPFADFAFDAILGLGLEGLSTSDDFNFIKMMSKRQWPSQPGLEGAFSVFLAQVGGSEESEITFGGVNTEHIAEGEEMKWCQVLDFDIGYWQIPITTISVDGVPLDYCNDGTCRAIVDTGSSLISVPRALGLELRNKLAHEGVDEDRKCRGPGPRLEFTICNFTITMDPKNYARPKIVKNNKTDSIPAAREAAISAGNLNQTEHKTTNDNRCVAMLMFMSLPPPLSPKTIVFGEPVLQKYYTSFDAKSRRIGFTESQFRPFSSEEAIAV